MSAQEYYNAPSGSLAPAGAASNAPPYPLSPVPQHSIPPPHPNGPPPPYSAMSEALNSHSQHGSDGKHSPSPQRQQYSAPPQQNGSYGYSQYPPQPQPQSQPQTQTYRYYYPDRQPNQYYGQQQYSQYPQQGYPTQAPLDQQQQAYGLRPQSQPPPRPNGVSPAPYRRDSRSASRHRHSRRHSSDKHHESSRSTAKKGRLDTFVGAGGGAIIGDAIFPGLGTLGGAILGGVGGHKVAEEKRRKSRTEDKYRRASEGRSRDYYSDYEDERVGRRRY